jgi:hypothetical protein
MSTHVPSPYVLGGCPIELSRRRARVNECQFDASALHQHHVICSLINLTNRPATVLSSRRALRTWCGWASAWRHLLLQSDEWSGPDALGTTRPRREESDW